MDRMDIETLWKEHCAAKFPDSCKGEELEGIDLVLLDADIAGCVSAFIGDNGSLDAPRRQLLRELGAHAERVSTTLDPIAGREYFERLYRLSQMILTEVD